MRSVVDQGEPTFESGVHADSCAPPPPPHPVSSAPGKELQKLRPHPNTSSPDQEAPASLSLPHRSKQRPWPAAELQAARPRGLRGSQLGITVDPRGRAWASTCSLRNNVPFLGALAKACLTFDNQDNRLRISNLSQPQTT